MIDPNKTAFVATLIQDLIPTLVNVVKAHHARVNPDLPPLTDAEAEEALHAATSATVAKDDQWLQAKGLPRDPEP